MARKFRHTPYFRTHGEGMAKRSLLETSNMVRAKASLASARFDSAENKQGVMACDTFGLILAASTSQAALNFKRP
jgi:hypothetical protein